MKNLVIALVCYAILLTVYIIDNSIIRNEYWFAGIIALFIVGGYNLGISFSKLLNYINKKKE